MFFCRKTILNKVMMTLYITLIRRINTEEKTKVVAAVWGTEFIKFPAALAVLN